MGSVELGCGVVVDGLAYVGVVWGCFAVYPSFSTVLLFCTYCMCILSVE